MELAEEKRHFSLPFHVVKRLDTPKKTYWAIKIAGFFVALLLAGVICTILTPGSFGLFYKEMFLGVFDPADSDVLLELLETAGLLLLVAFALAPAFKMKFWNIGGEGQILIACLATAGITKFLPVGTSDITILVICFFSAIAAGIIWAVIPAIFKAFFNTNETLFTLMMNYIAMALIAICINIWVPDGSMVFGRLTRGAIPEIGGMKYIINIVIVAIVVVLMIVYLKKTKHGYELSVVGESVNTARYVGINVRKVIIRTMVLSGAICGLVGFLLVAGHHHTLSTGLADGRGFTGVLVAWLGGFQPGQMILYAFLVAIFQCGSKHAASYMGMSSSEFSAIVTGMFFLIVIASEFFVNYKIMKKVKEVVEEKKEPLTVPSFTNEVQQEPEHIDTQILHKDDIKQELEKVENKKEEKKPSKKQPAKKVEKKSSPKKEETKPAKKAETKKPSPKKEEKKPVEKKAEAKKPETKKPTAKKPASKKPAAKKTSKEGK